MTARLALVQDHPASADDAERAAGTGRRALVEDGCLQLARAFDSERRAIQELRQALQRQRAAVAADDAAALELSADHVGRAVATLGEARRCRGEIMHAIAGRADATLAELERSIGRPLPGPLQDARAAVLGVAIGAAGDVAINQHVLRRALDAGDAFLQRLFSSMADPMPVYAPQSAPRTSESRAVLLNRRA